MRQCATTLEPEFQPEELQTLLEHLRECKYTGHHLEIGTAAGGTLCQMIPATHGPFTVIDPMQYFPNQMQTVRQNLQNHDIDPKSVRFWEINNEETLMEAQDNKEVYDFILIDGNHKYRHVLRDLQWSSLVRVGGTIALHDYTPSHPGVMRAVHRFLRKNPNYEVRKKIGSLLILMKKAESEHAEISAWDLLHAEIYTPLMQLRDSLKRRLSA